MRISGFLFLLVISSHIGFGQEKKWTLRECIDYSLENNLDVLQSNLEVENARITLSQSRMSRLPDLAGNLLYGRSWGRSIDPTSNDFITQQTSFTTFNVGSSVTLFNGLRTMNTIKQDEGMTRASELDQQSIENMIVLNVVTFYTNVIFNKELYDNANAQLGSTQQQVERTRKQVDAGALPNSSLLELQAQEATNELNVINQENMLNLSLLQLKQLLQLPATEMFDVEVPELATPDDYIFVDSQEDVYEISQGVMPEVQSAKLKVQSAEYGIQASRGWLYPQLTLSGGLRTNYASVADRERFVSDGGDPTVIQNPEIGYVAGTGAAVYSLFPRQIPSGSIVDGYPFPDQINDNLSKSVSLNLYVPIFNRFSARANIQRSEINYERNKIVLEKTRNELRQSIERAYNDVVAGSKSYGAAQKQVNAREEAFRVIEQKYNLGASDFVEYQVAENDLFRARSDLLRAKYDFVFKKMILDFYQGKPLDF